MHCRHASRLPPGDLQKPWEILVFLHAPPKGGPYQYHRNLTNTQKPFKNQSKMNDFTVWPCASPSPARSGSWRPRWIPRGAPFKNIDFGSYKLWLDFSRFLTHLVLWNSTDGHSVQDADLTNSIKILLIHRNPYKNKQKWRISHGSWRSPTTPQQCRTLILFNFNLI